MPLNFEVPPQPTAKEIEENEMRAELKQLELETGQFPARDYFFAKLDDKEKMGEEMEKFSKLPLEEQKEKLERSNKLRKYLEPEKREKSWGGAAGV